MARLLAANPTGQKGKRSAMNSESDRSSSRVEDFGEDPFALTENCDYPPPSTTAKVALPMPLGDKPAADDDDEVAIPIPIATLVFQDGRTEPVYKPLAGHEHLFKARPMIASPASFSNRVPHTQRPIQPAPIRVPEPSQHVTTLEARLTDKPQRQSTLCKQRKLLAHRQGLPKSKSLKRTRSVAQGLAPTRKAVVDDDAINQTDSHVQVVTEESHTFYIGDIDAFKDFLRCRFDELTMKPLRGIATHWVKLLEPRRLGDWGKYHEMLPTEADTPPWWPKTVIYKEPSHLKKSDLSTLAVEMMLVHREIDEIKRKGSWITKLRDVAKFTVQTTSADHFSSSKGAAHSEEMKKRALEQILPSIFNVAQAYEDHIMQYSLFEGSGNADPGRGKHHTWKPIPRPIRRQQPKRPRRAAEGSLEAAHESHCEASGDETEADDTMTRLAVVPCRLPQVAPSPLPVTVGNVQTPRQSAMVGTSQQPTWKVDTPASTSGPCTPVTCQDECTMHRTTSTPNSSFDQSLHGLHLGEEDLSLKPHARTMSDGGNMHGPYSMAPYSQPVPYAATGAGFGGTGYPPADNYGSTDKYASADNYANPAPAPFAQNGPGFINPFAMFNAAPGPLSYGSYTSSVNAANGFPYEQGMYSGTPMSFPNTPMSMPLSPSDGSSMSFNGLGCEYPVDGQGVHPF